MSVKYIFLTIILLGWFISNANGVVLNIIDYILGQFMCKSCLAPDGTRYCCKDLPGGNLGVPGQGVCPPIGGCLPNEPIFGFSRFCTSDIDCRGIFICCFDPCSIRRICTIPIIG